MTGISGTDMEKLIRLEEALKFYADPENYFGVAVLGDSPCGEFADDWGYIGEEETLRPGRRAREALDPHEHDWQDPTNLAVDANGYDVCMRCGALEKKELH